MQDEHTVSEHLGLENEGQRYTEALKGKLRGAHIRVKEKRILDLSCRDKKRASYTRKHTKAQDILMKMKNKADVGRQIDEQRKQSGKPETVEIREPD